MSGSGLQPLEKVEAFTLTWEKTSAFEDLFVVSGRRAYMVGDQNGGFPPLGLHLPGEMSGVWTHSAKLLDGFWLKLTGMAGSFYLDAAQRFVVGAGYCEHVYELPALGLTVTRRDWIPDDHAAVVVELDFRNQRDLDIPLEMDLHVQVNIRPAWRAEELQIRDGQDELYYLDDLHAFCAEDTLNGWSVVVGTDHVPTYHELGAAIEDRQRASGPPESGVLLHYYTEIKAKGGASMRLYVAGSLESAQAARTLYEDIQVHHPLYFEEKGRRLEDLANRSRLALPDPTLNQAFLWAKLNFASLEADTQAGRGLVGGYPDAPWFCGLDICLAAEALAACGQHEILRSSLELLATYAKNWFQGEEVPNVITGQGAPFHRANVVALPLFVSALDTYLRWTGDRNFVQKHMPIALILQTRLQTERKGLNLVPRGAGLLEKPGYANRSVDVASILFEALNALESLCQVFGETAMATWARRRSEEYAIMLAQTFWLSDNNIYADMCATQPAVTGILDGIVRRLKTMTREQLLEHLPLERLTLGAEEAVPEGVMYGWAGRNWISVYPFVVGLGQFGHAQAALPKYETGHHMATWGLMMQGAADKKVTALGTGLLALAQVRYGRVAAALQTARRMALSLGQEMPGMFSEFLPDQGCLVRTSAPAGLVSAFVQNLLGIRPNLGQRTMQFVPQLTPAEGVVRLDDVRLGELTMSFAAQVWERTGQAAITLDTFGFPCFIGFSVPSGVEAVVNLNGTQQRTWDTQERKIDGRRCVGMVVDLQPGLNILRVDW